MKFGELPVHETAGCILAHSIATPMGRLRKGIVLNAAHIKQLQNADVVKVTVARLEDGDVEENEAARQLGAALIMGCEGLNASVAATGRVNIFAKSAGVAILDEARLKGLNSVNPMITLATVPNHYQTHKGGMLGTVKIISYAVPNADLQRACELAAQAMRLAKPESKNVSLIITQFQKSGDESKAIAATKDRVTALGSSLCEVVTCAHELAALSDALRNAKGEVVLILTASATSDAQDVAPASLLSAGGTLTRFGMPVDPGNLLFLGLLHGKTVIGLPGCARSPALNGADKVLSRVLCGVDVSSADIAEMGVGGLLKEIPTRPRPRRG